MIPSLTAILLPLQQVRRKNEKGARRRKTIHYPWIQRPILNSNLLLLLQQHSLNMSKLNLQNFDELNLTLAEVFLLEMILCWDIRSESVSTFGALDFDLFLQGHDLSRLKLYYRHLCLKSLHLSTLNCTPDRDAC